MSFNLFTWSSCVCALFPGSDRGKSSSGFLWTALKTHDCNSVQFDYFDNSLTVYSFLSPLSISSHIKFLVNNVKQILSNGTADHMAAFTAKQPQEMQHVHQFKCYFY